MFRTHQSDIAGVPGMFGDGLSHWHGVSRALSTHWYHLTVKRMVDGRFVNSEVMLNDETRLVEALRGQDESDKVAEVRVVTPSWMNKDSDWKMQKLISLSMGYNKSKVAICILKVEGGEVYIDSHEPGVSVESLTDIKELYRSRTCNDQPDPESRGVSMSDTSAVEIEFHEKRFSDFDLLRIARASGQEYEDDITAYLTNVQVHGSSAVGVVFGHTKKEPSGRYADGHLIKTSDILLARKEGRFWVLTTINSTYVIATFRRDCGRKSFREFQRVIGNRYPNI